MIQSISLHFLLLRKHESDLNNFEYFLNICENKIIDIVDPTAK